MGQAPTITITSWVKTGKAAGIGKLVIAALLIN